MIPFPKKKYKVIYADPPWQFNNKNTGGSLSSGSANHYDVMNLDAICSLPVGEIADDDCILFMWWVGSQPEEALKVVTSWGFTLKTMTGFNWVKETESGKDFFGMGFWTRGGSENCLIAVKGKPQKVSSSVRSVTRAKVGKHSEKPDAVAEKIVELMGDVSRIELFARKRTVGWDAWGLEVE
jgi:N6-adenosine-specific RNA methylase IME4